MNSTKRNIIVALMVAMFLAAFEGTVVATAIPTIVKDLNGFNLVSWIFSLYLLTSAVSTPIYGKLSDIYGRKNILCIGIIIFLVGSFLCGLSQNMYHLIASRALQGFGAGAIFTVTFTIVGDVFTVEERAIVQGGMSTVWGVASLVGPFLGGFLIDSLSWHWIFFINIPFGIVSIIVLQRNLKVTIEHKLHKIDYEGTIVLSASIIVFLYGILLGDSTQFIILSFCITALLLVAFYFIEKKAEEPIVPFDILSRESTVVNLVSFLASIILIAVSVYMPLYIQNVLGFNATIAGLTMAPMSLAWLSCAVFLSKAIPSYGARMVTVLSSLFLLLGCFLLATLGVQSSLIQVVIYTSIMGFGFGGVLNTLTIMVQESVDYDQRGVAMALNSLIRTLAQTIGISIFGTIVNVYIANYFQNRGIEGIDLNSLYSSVGVNNVVAVEYAKASLDFALHVVFMMLIVVAVICAWLSFFLSRRLGGKADH